VQQLAAGTEITLIPRMLLKQEQVKMGNGANKKKKLQRSNSQNIDRVPANLFFFPTTPTNPGLEISI
jgi:hypothetical protein